MIGASTAPRRLNFILVSAFALVAVVLTCAGLYGAAVSVLLAAVALVAAAVPASRATRIDPLVALRDH